MAETPTPQPQEPLEVATDTEQTPAAPLDTPAVLPSAAPQAPSLPQVAPQTHVNVLNPEGSLVSIPVDQLPMALDAGYSRASDTDIEHFANEEKYGGTGEQVKTFAEGVGQGLVGPLAPAVEKAFGAKGEDIRGRAETNPTAHLTGEVTGLAGPALVSAGASTAARAGVEGAAGLASAAGALEGVTQSGLAAHVGEGVAQAAGLGGEAASTLSKIGSAAVKGAVDNMIIQSGDEVGKMITQDPNQSAQTALIDIGLAGLIGGGVGGSVGAISPLWKAGKGALETHGLLSAIADKAGGIEGVPGTSDAVQQALDKSGMKLAPEIRAGLSDNPEMQQIAKTLEQSDTSKSGLKYQESYGKFRKDAGDTMVKAMGKEPEAVSTEVSKYEHGKSIGETLATEYQEKLDPIVSEFEGLKGKYKDIELPPSHPGVPEAGVPAQVGTIAKVTDDIAKLAQEQGWTASPSSEIMREVNRVMEELPKQKTLKNLNAYMTAISDNTKSTLPFGQQTPLSRAGQMMKKVLQNAEGDLLIEKVGSEEGAAAVERYKLARKAYGQQASLKNELNDRLHIGDSTGGFGKALRNMAKTDGETVLNRLSGKDDASLLEFLSSNFPKTAEKIRNFHVDSLLEQAAKRAKPGETINANALLKNIEGMSPELRAFTLSQEGLDKVQAVGQMLDQFDKLPHNFSNTARTADKLLQYVPGSALAMATMLSGHNPVAALVLGSLTKALSKDAPDAIRLGLLKFLGSGQQIESEAFKNMVHYIAATQKGETLLARSTKALFHAGTEVLPQTQMPSKEDREKLDKRLQSLKTDQRPFYEVGGKTSHYMPEHGQAMGQVAVNATNYLNTLRPNTDKKSPLDQTPPKVNPVQKAQFDRALNIAQQPLVVMNHIKEGTLTSHDVIALRTMYPDLYTRMSEKVGNEMVEAVSRGETIPYKTRLGLSLFLGQPLDSTMTPQAIAAAQPQPVSQGPQQQGQAPKKGTSSAFNKLPGMYQTPGQARTQRQSRD